MNTAPGIYQDIKDRGEVAQNAPVLKVLDDRLDATRAALATIIERLSGVACRTLGDEPPAPVKSPPTGSVARCIADEMHLHLDGIGDQLGDLHRIAVRLETLA